jgi:hypothetical protein
VAVTAAISALSYPWASSDTRSKLETYATDYATRYGPTLDSHDHVERQTVIRAMLMAGPDGLLH